jgi:hypothetical protein
MTSVPNTGWCYQHGSTPCGRAHVDQIIQFGTQLMQSIGRWVAKQIGGYSSI